METRLLPLGTRRRDLYMRFSIVTGGDVPITTYPKDKYPLRRDKEGPFHWSLVITQPRESKPSTIPRP